MSPMVDLGRRLAPSFPHATLISPVQVAVASGPLPPVIRTFLPLSSICVCILMSLHSLTAHILHPFALLLPHLANITRSLNRPRSLKYYILPPLFLSRPPLPISTLLPLPSSVRFALSRLFSLVPLLFCTFYFALLHPLPRPRVFALSRPQSYKPLSDHKPHRRQINTQFDVDTRYDHVRNSTGGGERFGGFALWETKDTRRAERLTIAGKYVFSTTVNITQLLDREHRRW